MKNEVFRIGGKEIELTPAEMCTISEFYEVQCTADYLRNTQLDTKKYSEDDIQEIAGDVRRHMDKYGYDESAAIDEVLSERGD